METNIEVCPKCGEVREKNSKFCVGCGYRFSVSVIDSLRLHASRAKGKTSEIISPEKASQAVQNMVDVVTYVAQDMKQGMSSEMVKAVTVSARVSFVAFSIGVTIALDKLPTRESRLHE
jgi:hypothetical protein